MRASSRAVALAQAAVAQQRAGRLAEAARLYEQVAELVPPSAAVLCNLGECYRGLERRDRALSTFRRALALEPKLAALHFNVALTLDQLGRFSEAAESYQTALELDPQLERAGAFLLQALRDDGQLARAVAAYDELRARLPDSAELRRAIGNVLADLFSIDEAVAHFQRGLELDPGSAELHADHAAALVERGEIEEAIRGLRRALELDPRLVRAHASIVYLSAFAAGAHAKLICDEARRFDAAHAAERLRPESYPNSRRSDRRLRIGYVSPDFRAHPVASFLPEVLRHHDRSRFEVFCYSNVRKPDAVTQQFRALADQWRDVVNLTDEAAAELVARDQIDVLLDLAMHSGGSRPLLFARKPAPVQACWLAYPGTTGLDAVDYRLTDGVIDPPGASDEAYSERSWRLSGCFWCYAPPEPLLPVNALPALTAGHVTFGSPNSFKKVSDRTLELWARVLQGVPRSRLLIVAPDGRAWQRVEQAFSARGIESARLERLPHAPRAQYLAAIQRMDCVLDCVPYNGGTASFDALYLGVPVITLAGTTAAGRAGASIAHHLGLPELVAASSDELVARARDLTSDLARLAELRAGLRERLAGSVLMDSARFTSDIERCYRGMFEAWASTAERRG